MEDGGLRPQAAPVKWQDTSGHPQTPPARPVHLNLFHLSHAGDKMAVGSAQPKENQDSIAERNRSLIQKKTPKVVLCARLIVGCKIGVT